MKDSFRLDKIIFNHSGKFHHIKLIEVWMFENQYKYISEILCNSLESTFDRIKFTNPLEATLRYMNHNFLIRFVQNEQIDNEKLLNELLLLNLSRNKAVLTQLTLNSGKNILEDIHKNNESSLVL